MSRDTCAPCDITLVEVMGFEPTASSMRPKRSSQLSYTPEGALRIAEAQRAPERPGENAGSSPGASWRTAAG